MVTAKQSEATERVDSMLALCRRVLRSESPEGLQAVFLYGSYLERDCRHDSDVDFAILDDPGHPLSWADQARLMDVLERALGKGVDLRRLRESSPSHQAYVLEQGRLVWPRNPELVTRYAVEIKPAVQSERHHAEQEWPEVLRRLATRIR